MNIPVTLNVKSANSIPVISCMQGDTPTLVCTIMNDTEEFVVNKDVFDLCVCEGETAKHKAVTINASTSGNTVSVNMTKNETDEAGDIKLCIRFSNTKNNTVISTFPFILKATQNPSYTAVGQMDDVSALTDYVAEAKRYADNAKDFNVKEVQNDLEKEVQRAKEAETAITKSIDELSTATEQKIQSITENEQLIAQTIGEETRRAKETETAITNNFDEFKTETGQRFTEATEKDEALETRVAALESNSGSGSSGNEKNYKFSDSDSISFSEESVAPNGEAENTAAKILQITAAIKDGAITKEMLSEEVLNLFGDETLKKKYKQSLDDIYDALVSRGLIFPKENIEDYANQIHRLKMIDLDLQFSEDMANDNIANIHISTTDIDVDMNLTDNLTATAKEPAASGLSEDLSELTDISILKPVITVVDNMSDNIATTFE